MFFEFRAVKRKDLWVLQKRHYLIFWRDVYISHLLINGKDHYTLLPILKSKFGFKVIQTIFANEKKLYFKNLNLK